MRPFCKCLVSTCLEGESELAEYLQLGICRRVDCRVAGGGVFFHCFGGCSMGSCSAGEFDVDRSLLEEVTVVIPVCE